MGGIDPRAMKNMMAKMGIKSTDIDAISVTIECPGRDIVISEPQVTLIEAQGTKSFQIAGNVSEREKKVSIEITEEDIQMVVESSGVSDRDKVRAALEETNSNIAEAILKLKNG